MKAEILGTINLRCTRFVFVSKIHHVPADKVLVKEHKAMGGEDQLRSIRVDKESLDDVGEQVVMQRILQFIT